MGKYKDTSIKEIVKELNEKNYLIPDIQRPFVWKDNKNEFENKICSLFDSLLKGYPIGTLLFWKVDKKRIEEDNLTLLEFLSNSEQDKNNTFQNISSEKDYLLVLDGQQRMTIFNLVFNGTFEDIYRNKTRKRNLYFNLLSNKNQNKEALENSYEFKLLENNEKFFEENQKLWYKVKNILNIKNIFIEVDEILNEVDKFKEDKRTIGSNISSLDNSIRNDNISFYEIEKSKSDDEALEIFVRVNSGGVVLTYSHLLFSKITQYWKKDQKNETAREVFYNFLKADSDKKELRGINKYSVDGFKFTNDFILKTCLVLIEKEIRYRVKNFNEENIMLIKNNWDKITNSIKRVVELLNKIGIDSYKYLKSLNAIIPIIYFIYKKNLYKKDIEMTDINRKKYEKFIFIILLNGVFGGQADQLLSKSREVINSSLEDSFPLNELLKELGKEKTIIKEEQEIKEFLSNVKYGSDKCRIILKILYEDEMDSNSQEDHLFPKEKLKSLKVDEKKINNICNLQILKSENQIKSDEDFDKWLERIEKYIPDFKEISFIPNLDNYNIDNFDEFLEKRKEIIFTRIYDYFKF